MRAFTLMTALPPTKGHFNLMNFASRLGDERARVIVTTRPSEPFPMERYQAVAAAASRTNGVEVHWLHEELPQDPSTPGFWEMWDGIMARYGFKPGDIFTSSEPYGETLAKRMQGIFMPYDPQRELYYTKATKIREQMLKYFHDIMPEFQHVLRTRVTVFGAESTGKTTLSKEMSYTLGGHWLFEWARPYLTTVGNKITVDSMTAIWRGQLAIQQHVDEMHDKPFVIQDTDLFSTIGYWEQPHWADVLGPVPQALIDDAKANMSDLYVVTRANIPFEQDDLRYGVDRRESPDVFWLDVADRYELPYLVLDSDNMVQRNSWACKYAKDVAEQKAKAIEFDRGGF